MKNLLILLFFFPFVSFSQTYTEVVETPGKSAIQLYSSAIEWFAIDFASEDNAVLMEDPVSGKIIGKGLIYFSDVAPASSEVAKSCSCSFLIKVLLKDEKYRCEIANIIIYEGNQENKGTAFKRYLDKKEYYENAGDPMWLLKNPPNGVPLEKSTAKSLAKQNQATYNLIWKTESGLKDLMAKLRLKMEQAEDEW